MTIAAAFPTSLRRPLIIEKEKYAQKKLTKCEKVFPALRIFTKGMLLWVEGPPFVDLRDF